MAGTVVETHGREGSIGVVTLTLTGDASDGTIPATALSVKIAGLLLALATNPGATAPTSNYDITLIDGDGHDVLEGVGANRHTSNSEKVAIVYSGTVIHPPVSTGDTLTLTIAGQSVNDADIVVKLYYQGAHS